MLFVSGQSALAVIRQLVLIGVRCFQVDHGAADRLWVEFQDQSFRHRLTLTMQAVQAEQRVDIAGALDLIQQPVGPLLGGRGQAGRHALSPLLGSLAGEAFVDADVREGRDLLDRGPMDSVVGQADVEVRGQAVLVTAASVAREHNAPDENRFRKFDLSPTGGGIGDPTVSVRVLAVVEVFDLVDVVARQAG